MRTASCSVSVVHAHGELFLVCSLRLTCQYTQYTLQQYAQLLAIAYIQCPALTGYAQSCSSTVLADKLQLLMLSLMTQLLLLLRVLLLTHSYYLLLIAQLLPQLQLLLLLLL